MMIDAPRRPYSSRRVWLVIAIIALLLVGIILFIRFFPADIGDQRSKSIRAEVIRPGPTGMLA